jgi:flagellar M-ring protein FliF
MMKKVIGPDSPRGKANALQSDDQAGAVLTALPQHSSTAHMMEIAKVNGQIRAETVDQVGNMVVTNPQETVAVLRNWIHGR